MAGEIGSGAAARDLVAPARTRVRRGDERALGRERHRLLGADDHDVTVLERLPEGLEARPRELGRLVEEQHAVVGERDLARAAAGDPPPSSAEVEIVWCGARNGRCSTRPPLPRARRSKCTLVYLERLGPGHRGSTVGIRRASIVLPVPGGPLQQQVVAARDGDRDRRDERVVAAHVGQVDQRLVVARRMPGGDRRKPGAVASPRKDPRRASPQRLRTADAPRSPSTERRLGRAVVRQQQAVRGRAGAWPPRARARPGSPAARPRATARPRAAVGERRRLELPGRRQYGDRQWEIEVRALLAQERGGEVDRDPLLRELEAGVRDRRAHALARLADRLVRQPDDRERRKPEPDVALDRHAARLHAVDREARHRGQHVRTRLPGARAPRAGPRRRRSPRSRRSATT